MSGHLTNYFRSLTHHQFTHQIKVEGVALKKKKIAKGCHCKKLANYYGTWKGSFNLPRKNSGLVQTFQLPSSPFLD